MGSRIIRLVSVLIIALFMHLGVKAAEQRVEGGGLIFSDVWQVQPAKSVEQKPVSGDWAEMKTGIGRFSDWRSQRLKSSHTSWAKVKRADVHSIWLRQVVDVPADFKDRYLLLDFVKIQGDAIVFINGKKIGELLRPGGEMDVSSFIKPGAKNEIMVFLTRDYTDISRGFEKDYLRYIARSQSFKKIKKGRWALGIGDDVILKSKSKSGYIYDAFAMTSWRNKELNMQTEVVALKALNDVEFKVTVMDEAGKRVLSYDKELKSLPAGRSDIDLKKAWANPVTWEVDRGYIYTAKIELYSAGKLIDEMPDIKFGFREIWTEGRNMMLNGHPLRLRMTLDHGITPNSIGLFRLMGFNATYIQNNPSMWWCDWSETPSFDEDKLVAMDKAGFAVSAPAGNIAHIRENLVNNPEVIKAYEREMKWHMRRYRNHPSILFWTLGMNSYNPRDAISPQGMGRRKKVEGKRHVMELVIEAAEKIVKKSDNTRLCYSHADGNLGDVSSANVYLNFAPLQEREEWMSAWAKNGNMPFMAVEFGQPYTANFWKHKRFLLTEYLAMNLGEEAYAKEGEAGREDIIEVGLANKHGHGNFNKVDLEQYPAYWDFQRLFVRNTNRAYRSWGFNGGWAYWILSTVFGNPPGYNPNNRGMYFTRYNLIKKPVTKVPDWVSPNFAIHAQANKPLLAYIAGYPVHTDKSHSFYAGQKVKKQLAFVWDGPGSAEVKGEWELKSVSGNVAGRGKFAESLKAGDIRFIPVEFTAPRVDKKERFELVLKGTSSSGAKIDDKFELTVFPEIGQSVAGKLAGKKIKLYDPAGKSGAWLEGLGVKYTQLKAGEKVGDADILIVGREALKPGEAVVYTPEQIQAGLRVLILEQKPKVWKGLGLRLQQVMPRYVFAGVSGSDVLSGLDELDLRNWRGAPDLLPAGVNQPVEARHAPKWSNTHALSSVMLQAPRVAGFTPLLRCGFDLDYSPLLEWRYGKGGIWFSALDFTGRVGAASESKAGMLDAAASKLAANLLGYLGQAPAVVNERELVYDGDTQNIEMLEKLLEVSKKKSVPTDNKKLLVVAAGSRMPVAKIREAAQNGANVLVLPQAAKRYSEFGLDVTPHKITKAVAISHPLFSGVGSNLLRWRDKLDILAITGGSKDVTILGGGVFAVQKLGKGVIVYSQVSPLSLSGRYADDKDRKEAIEVSVWRLEQLISTLLTNLGGKPSLQQAQRLAYLDLGPQYEVIRHWNVLGPFAVEREDGKLMLDTAFPGEETAVAGDFNPNNTFVRKDGAQLNWRTTVKADSKGKVDLGEALGKHSLAVAYVIATVKSDVEREAVLRVGADWRLRAWVNGKEVFRTLSGLNKAGAYRVKVKLKKGENLISFKVGSGSKGFSFYADISSAQKTDAVVINDSVKGVSFYAGSSEADEFDPYEYHYW